MLSSQLVSFNQSDRQQLVSPSVSQFDSQSVGELVSQSTSS